MLTRWLLAWQTLALPLLRGLSPRSPSPCPYGERGGGRCHRVETSPGARGAAAQTGGRGGSPRAQLCHLQPPGISTFRRRHRLHPQLQVSHARSSLRSLPGGARGGAVGAVGAVPYGVMDSRMFLGGDQPHTPLSSSRISSL